MTELGAELVTLTRRYHLSGVKTDERLVALLKDQQKQAAIISGNLLWEPEEISKQDGTPYKVFTPFYRRGCLNAVPPRTLSLPRNYAMLPPPPSHSVIPDRARFARWRRLAAEIIEDWEISEEGGQKRLRDFYTSRTY